MRETQGRQYIFLREVYKAFSCFFIQIYSPKVLILVTRYPLHLSDVLLGLRIDIVTE